MIPRKSPPLDPPGCSRPVTHRRRRAGRRAQRAFWKWEISPLYPTPRPAIPVARWTPVAHWKSATNPPGHLTPMAPPTSAAPLSSRHPRQIPPAAQRQAERRDGIRRPSRCSLGPTPWSSPRCAFHRRWSPQWPPEPHLPDRPAGLPEEGSRACSRGESTERAHLDSSDDSATLGDRRRTALNGSRLPRGRLVRRPPGPAGSTPAS